MPPPDDAVPLSRENLAERTERVLRPARRAKPAIVVARDGERRVLVKDFAHNDWLTRQLYGRWVVGRESIIYRRLKGVDGVPAFHGRLDAFAFAVEYVEGATLKALPRDQIRPEAFDRLARTFQQVHARGIVHLDAHQKTNVVVTPDGRPHLVDFATALSLGRHWLARRVLVPFFSRADWLGFLKLKAHYCPEALPAQQARRLRTAELAAWLWPPNLVRRLFGRLTRRWRRPHRAPGREDG